MELPTATHPPPRATLMSDSRQESGHFSLRGSMVRTLSLWGPYSGLRSAPAIRASNDTAVLAVRKKSL